MCPRPQLTARLGRKFWTRCSPLVRRCTVLVTRVCGNQACLRHRHLFHAFPWVHKAPSLVGHQLFLDLDGWACAPWTL